MSGSAHDSLFSELVQKITIGINNRIFQTIFLNHEMMGINYVNYFHYMIWLIKYFDPFIFSFCYTYSHIFPHRIRHIYGNFKVHRNVHELLFNDCRRLNVCRSKLLRKAHPNKMKLFSFRKSATTERYVYMTGNEIYDVVFPV